MWVASSELGGAPSNLRWPGLTASQSAGGRFQLRLLELSLGGLKPFLLFLPFELWPEGGQAGQGWQKQADV